QRLLEFRINRGRREQIKLELFELRVVIAIQPLSVRFRNLGSINNNLTRHRCQIRGRADRAESLGLDQFHLPLRCSSNSVPGVSKLTLPLRVCRTLGPKSRLLLLLFVEERFVHAVVLAGNGFYGVFEPEDLIRSLSCLLGPACRISTKS